MEVMSLFRKIIVKYSNGMFLQNIFQLDSYSGWWKRLGEHACSSGSITATCWDGISIIHR